MYTQQFEREETAHDDQQTTETETVGTVQERISDTNIANRRTNRAVSKAVNEKTEAKEPPIV